MRFDKYQERVINASGGYHLVLAPPGCGKTELLTQRILKANIEGVPYEDMLCLTFTNRAARNMKDRIRAAAGGDCEGLFVGNIHRFCSRFLFENKLISSTTGIIDELDQRDILDDFGFTKYNETRTFRSERIDLSDVTKLASILYQKEHKFPQELMLTEPTFFDTNKKHVADELARKYYSYKKMHSLLDFDDILLLAYTRMRSDDYVKLMYSQYHWIQVDEVQDMSPLQHGIIDKLTSKEASTVMYLGDEQQAIYSFMGAKLSTLGKLSSRCTGNIHRLYTNYRSPKYLVETFNEYAEKQLGIPKEILPKPGNNEDVSKGRLNAYVYPTTQSMDGDIPSRIQSLLKKFPDERIAILTRTNAKAESISEGLTVAGIEHFRLSGQDIFRSDEYKALTAHFLVTQRDTASFIDWARILWKTGATPSFTDARNIVSKLRMAAMTPTDLFLREDGHCYVNDFFYSYNNEELVIFDTETTGLDVFEDDIIQIAAIKIRKGEILPSSEFNVLVRTEKEIPALVGGEPNPMIQAYREAERKGSLLSPSEAFSSFLNYVGEDEVVGHNVNYDYQILRYNLLRRCSGIKLEEHIPIYWDSLKLIRLIEPHLREYKLKTLLETFHLEGENSHRADDDILATKSLIDYCAGQIPAKKRIQDDLFRDINIRNVAEKLRKRYRPLYVWTMSALNSRTLPVKEAQTPFLFALDLVYNEFLSMGSMLTIPGFNHLMAFLSKNVFSEDDGLTLRAQVEKHLSDIRTYSQADICDSGVIQEKVYVMTVHKAKGLEFEHVIIYDAVDGTYPFFLCNSDAERKEEARLFYVGMSRAKKRVTIMYGMWYQQHKKSPTPFLHCIAERFTTYQPKG